ncbi:TPA: zonular occludens toxin domain-containing protein [Salmonella enterica]
MAVYFTKGELGAGKGIYAAFIASQYYNNPDKNIRLATNYPLDTYRLGKDSHKEITVLPCSVRVQDLEFLGAGSPPSYKDNFGCLIIDECSEFLNSRDFKRSDRLKMLDWFRHARKHHWDVYFIVQDYDSLDSQLREALLENLVYLRDLSKIRIPFYTSFKEMFGNKQPRKDKRRNMLIPHIVQARIYYKRKSAGDKPVNFYSIMAKDYYNFYDTDFKFVDGIEFLNNKEIDMRVPYTLLPGKYLSLPLSDWTNWHEGRDMGVNSHFDAKNLISVSSETNKNDNPQSEKSVKKLRFGLRFFFKFSFFILLGYISYQFITHYVFKSDEKSSDILTYNAVVVDKNGQPVNVSAYSVPASPPEPVISSRWRLTGYLKRSDNEGYFILRDTSGNIRYFRSDSSYDGQFTQITVDNEIVTFYSGASSAAPSLPLTSDLSGAVGGTLKGSVSSILN